MVVSAISSGLGNQLFQYAMGRRLALRRGVPLRLDLTWFQKPLDLPGLARFNRRYQLDAFHIQAEPATPEELARFTIPPLRRADPRRLRGPWWRFKQRYLPAFCRGMKIFEADSDSNFKPGFLHLPGDVHLQGYWQSERYFADVAEVLRAELTLRDQDTTARASALIEAHRQNQRPVVGIQVRRGDVARAHEVLRDLTHMPYELVSREYLQTAMSIFGEEATFLVFSDTAEDMAWCRANLHARDIHFVRGENDLQDFSTLTNCDHQIISNSSFGWWAAWLNPNPHKTVVAPLRWFRREHNPGHDPRSLIPAAWQLR